MFNSKRPDINLLINGDGQPADRLLALVTLWNDRASAAIDLHPNDECRRAESLIYHRCAIDLIEALITVYPEWHRERTQKKTPMSIDSNTIDQLQDELYHLAGQWRNKHSTALVKKYHQLYKHMVELGWDQSLDVEDHLPAELMPQEYHDLGKKPSHGQP